MDAIRAQFRLRGSLDVSAVASAAGVTTATFYNHFDTNEDSIVAAFDVVLQGLVATSDDIVTIALLDDSGPLETMRLYVDREVGLLRADSQLMRAGVALIAHHPGARAVFRRAESIHLAHLVEVLTEAKENSVIDINDPKATAESLLVLAHGVNHPRLLRPRANRLRQQYAAGMALLLTPRT